MRDELIQQTLVVLDPGKGGEDLGANVRTDKGWLKEKDINLSLAYILNGYLRHAGIDVLMSRYGDDDLGTLRRIEIINAMQPDLIISLNMAIPKFYANFIYHYELTSNSEIICEFLMNELGEWGFFSSAISVIRAYKGIMEKTYAPCLHLALGNISKERESFSNPTFLLEYANVLGHALLEGFKRANWERDKKQEAQEQGIIQKRRRKGKPQAPTKPPGALVIAGKKWKSP